MNASPAVVQSRIDSLLRTGRWVDVPYDAQRQLAVHMKAPGAGLATGKPSAAVCLAL
jgi:hypothetical protein